jgi:cytosine/adenosine deaminase-related metal-dependent hydrolase
METLKSADSNVIYCPRSSDYFGWSHVFGPHRYQDMMKAGINIALGTDSIINLPQHDRISVLDEMRFLHARDSVSPQTLLAMATVNVARTLGIPADRFLFRTDAAPLGVLAIRIDGSSDPMGQIMRNNEQPRMLWSRW